MSAVEVHPYCLLTIEEAAAKLSAGEVTAEELVGHFLAHIEALEPQLNAFVRVEAELARSQAKESDERRKQVAAARNRFVRHVLTAFAAHGENAPDV